MSRKLTLITFIEKSVNKHGLRYDYSDVVYCSRSIKVIINCKEHGAFLQTPANHLDGQGCPKCAQEETGRKCRLTINELVNRSETVHGKGRFLYSKVKYTGIFNKIVVTCPKHGDFLILPSGLLEGHGCVKCYKEKITILDKKKYIERFYKEAKEIHGDRYDYSKVDYRTAFIKICVICQKHGEFYVSPHNHCHGKTGCPKCHLEIFTNSRRGSTEEFIAAATKLHGHTYDYSKVVYYKNTQKVKIGCPIHGYFYQAPSVHINGDDGLGCGCPLCFESKGEARIAEWLTSNFIPYVRQKMFSDCRNKGMLKFDFYLPDYKIIIEFDGLQHTMPIKLFGGERTFKIQIMNDLIKNKYCVDNNFTLIRIPYKDRMHIPDILATKLGFIKINGCGNELFSSIINQEEVLV